VGLKLNGTYQLLDYVNYVNLLGDFIYTMKKKRGTWCVVVKALCYKP
jgi:hypothetical protein